MSWLVAATVLRRQAHCAGTVSGVIVKLLMPFLVILAVASSAPAEDVREDMEATEECRIGLMVKEISEAIASPEEAGAMETIVRYGTDSRHYVMIRGWLVEVLKGVDSRVDAATDEAQKKDLQTKASWLRKSIRRIDLE